MQLEQMRFRLLEAELAVETLPARRVETGAGGLMASELELCRAWQLRSTNPVAAAVCARALSSETYPAHDQCWRRFHGIRYRKN
ncbi:MAG: hypothetical protein JO033_19265 [Acidobacteriaceae bacterium]|nr:hypothetical protein [Acidobacteriaceae bacterium]MBV9498048.1 hypothetical protein [Acidobacteriaceae bacterium]